MESIMKKATTVLFFALLASVIANTSSASITVTWATQGTTFRAYAADGTTLLTAGTSSTAGFLQLIYLGANGAYDGYALNGTTGVAGDDTVLATSYIGQAAMAPADGRFTSTWINSSVAPNTAASRLVIRFFDTPSPLFASGTAPVAGNYGLSQVYTLSKDPTGTPDVETFAFNANYSASTPVAVPEPTTVALMLAGLAVLAGRRFVRS